ncbi:winged helix-turn-helix transcriptional regulator [Pseudoalteromonas sp. MMG010]|uniref:MarR family winged helix-turn-helix transcriptional regulator n=1 Tax=Pseudoalteromonas sp. MMG010 TaxID=2822685 RepID=UPI001B3A1935|nr:MarR family winged helix-turn-helix transcriptional regulator [Pseudoalteromonas sp. MMG010]MBQ4832071.1 winged helix-turn-helix transcriptional regulator [Pseudoalteromonas sp. MMG010]
MGEQKYKFHLLLHSADLIQEYLRVKLLPFGLTPNQARVIKTINLMGNISQVELAREFNITPASMSTMTSRLIALNLIKSQKDAKNAKRNLLRLSSKGHNLVNDISQVWQSVDEYIEQNIGIENTTALAELSEMLRDSLGGRMPEKRMKK